MMQDRVEVNQVEYRIIELLGHGKGGYSYLAERDGKQYVLKQIHHEPCDYYTFGNNYECNQYMDEWNFENWGIKYWSKTQEFMDYVNSRNKE